MQRYFIEKLDKINQTALLENNDFHHVKNVMRHRVNDQVIICDDEMCYLSTITEFTKKSAHLKLIEELQKPFKDFKVTIAQALIRRERFELMLQKSTELGVDYIIPTITKNTIIKLKDEKTTSKLNRWNTITKEASEQSHRTTKATVLDIKSMKDIDYSIYDLVLVAYEKETNNRQLKHILKDKYKNILVLIGPEGGFDPMEIEFLKEFTFIGLGPRILRSETASSYILSVLSYEYEMSDQ